VAFSNDRERYVAWQKKGSPAVVLDTRTRHRSTVPAGCELQDRAGAADGRFLVSCAAGPGVFDATSATLTPLPSREYGPIWVGVGTRYAYGAAGYGTSCLYGTRKEGCTASFDLATGTERLLPAQDVPEVDHPGAPPVCRALRRTLYDLRSGSLPAEGGYAKGLLVSWLKHGEDPVTKLQLDHCTGHRTIISSPAEPLDIEVGGGLVSWDTGHGTSGMNAREEYASTEEERYEHSGGELIIYSPATHRRTAWKLPQRPLRLPYEPTPVGVWGYSAHTDNDVFWAGAESGECGRGGCGVRSYVLYSASRRSLAR
jgi:hypothetical protein